MIKLYRFLARLMIKGLCHLFRELVPCLLLFNDVSTRFGGISSCIWFGCLLVQSGCALIPFCNLNSMLIEAHFEQSLPELLWFISLIKFDISVVHEVLHMLEDDPSSIYMVT